jgi:hypothetical protein
MAWADDATSLALATLESIRRLLADETSQLILLSEIAEETSGLVRRTRLDRWDVARVISAWRVFPQCQYAIEATPRRLGAVIEKYRRLGTSLPTIAGAFLSVLGTNTYVDRLSDSEEEWNTYREGGMGG